MPTKNSHISFLKEVPFFSEVSSSALEELYKFGTVESFKKNDVVFSVNDDGSEMYVILEGKVKVHDNNHVYGYLETGDCFGEYALIDNQKRSASITIEKDTQTLKIEQKDFLKLMQKDVGFAYGMLAVMIKRHRELDLVQERLASSKEELEIASAKMKGLIEGAMDAIIMFDSNFRIVLTNPSANTLLENEDVLQRNVLFFFDDDSAKLIEELIKQDDANQLNNFIPQVVKVIGSNETQTLNEGTISKIDGEKPLYTLILRNIEDRLQAQDQIELLTKQTEYLEQEIHSLTHTDIIGEHGSIKLVLNQIEQVAITDATVLVTGETGTGKELVARALHENSNRANQSFIRINCGAIPSNLIESELFGHVKGAFTGATTDRKGRFLLADKGTIFLDEIGELPLELQPKLLRVIQEGEFDPVGSSETKKVDVRIVAATHRDLLRQVKKEAFREDLYYRLNVFPIHIPALRDRGEDVGLIANAMLAQQCKKQNKPLIKLADEDKALLAKYSWPGNVRELQNLIERAVIVSKNGKINWSSIIPLQLKGEEAIPPVDSYTILSASELVVLEKENILKALKQTRWKISGKNGAAELLQLKPTTLASKIKALGIVRPI